MGNSARGSGGVSGVIQFLPRQGEGDRSASAEWWRGAAAHDRFSYMGHPMPHSPSTMLRMVPLPIPGRI
ncbi:hypothetical protein DTL00_07870 [Sphingomonas melonis]